MALFMWHFASWGSDPAERQADKLKAANENTPDSAQESGLYRIHDRDLHHYYYDWTTVNEQRRRRGSAASVE